MDDELAKRFELRFMYEIDRFTDKEGESETNTKARRDGFQDYKDYVRCMSKAQFQGAELIDEEGIVDPSIEQTTIGMIDEEEYIKYANKGVSDKFKLLARGTKYE